MASIRKIEDSLIPKDAIVCKNGMKTKKIYLKNDANEFFVFYNNFSVENGSILIASNETESIKTRKEYSDKIGEWVYIDLFNADTRIAYERVGDIIRSNSYPNGSYLIEFDEPITIAFDLNRYFYCIPEKTIELKPMPKIDKLIDSSTFENVSTKLQEINNLLKVSSDNLKTIMDANNLMYEPTDNFSTLVQKLNSEPINFLLEGTKVRDILNKHLGATTYAGEVGSSYHYVCFTNIKRQSWTDLKEDLSLKKDGSISLYHELVDKSDRNYHNYYYIYSENKIYANKDSSYIFNTKKNGFKSIDFENIYFDYVENASYMFYNFGEGYGTGIFNINNLKLKNAKNINYIFNGSNIGNINFVVYDKMESYSNFSPKYSTITLDYVNDKSKKIAESIIASNNDLKLGTLVTQ